MQKNDVKFFYQQFFRVARTPTLETDGGPAGCAQTLRRLELLINKQNENFSPRYQGRHLRFTPPGGASEKNHPGPQKPPFYAG